MVERIDKTDQHDAYWRIESTVSTQKEKRDQESHSDQYDDFDKTDWNLLFDKSQLWKKNIAIPKNEIEKIQYGKVNLKTDPCLLRVDIFLKNGTSIAPAFVSLARLQGLKIKNFLTGQELPIDSITNEEVLRITIPNKEFSKTAPPSLQPKNTEKTEIHGPLEKLLTLPDEMKMVYGLVGLLALVLVISLLVIL